MKISEHLQPKFKKDLQKFLECFPKLRNMGELQTKYFENNFKVAWIASEQDNFICSFYKDNKLGVPEWDFEDDNNIDLCIIEAMDEPLLIVKSLLPESKRIWSRLANFVSDKIEKENNIGKQSNYGYYASVFKNMFKGAPFNYCSDECYLGLHYDGY